MKIEEAANYLKEELARWERDCKSHHPMKDALALAIQMLETGEVYMTGDDYNLFIKGYKDGMKDYKSLVEESDPADSENKVRLIDADALKKKLNFVYHCAYIESKSKEGIASDIIDEIDNAPTVKIDTNDIEYKAYCKGLEDGKKIARPQGKWNYIQAGMCVCPFCGADPHRVYKNYCPKCGADMRGEEE
jgi:hypothetical protein